MQEVFEKIIEKLEELNIEKQSCSKCAYREECDAMQEKNDIADDVCLCTMLMKLKAIEIVKQTAEKYNNGWIPCSSGKLPDEGDEFYPMCFVTLDNGAVCLGVYRYDDKQWYTKMIKDETLYTTKRNIIAWQPLPEPYQPKGDKHGNEK